MVSNIPNLQPTSTTNAMVQVTFEIDNVALEPRESFRLTLDPVNLISNPQTAGEIFINTIDLTIIDSDGKFKRRSGEGGFSVPVDGHFTCSI